MRSQLSLKHFVVLGLVLLTFPNFAADIEVKVAEKAPPTEVSDEIKKQLQPKALQLLSRGKAQFEFWFAAQLPLQSNPESAAKSLQALKPTTFLGVAVVHENKRDYKDNDLFKNVYTMRFALQPQDGNHSGTADFPYFAVLVPVKSDTKLDGISDYKTLVKASSKDTPNDHPVIISLRPVSSEEVEVPKLSEPAPEHHSVRVKIPARVAGSDKPVSVVFELVYKGTGHI
ncbi:MAG: hypothetical protein FJ403_18895 [Verrucomicrobia bacterium]|nr:hypothetical protein [Verrucomicrobiota bacterium]